VVDKASPEPALSFYRRVRALSFLRSLSDLHGWPFVFYGIKVWLYVLLIAAMLIMVYKKLNDIKGHKEAKRLFVKAIDNEITRLIVEICGGNPDLTPILNST